jgi:hypothetical protein
MLARAPRAVLPSLSPETHGPHALHAQTRDWPQTNCFVDLWIELLHGCGLEPLAAFGFTVAQDFEGDHFTFSKMPPEALRALYGIGLQELALYDELEPHLLTQIERGRIPIVEVDGFFLPDTRGTSYRESHVKTTIAVNLLDPAARRMEYFHNDGYFRLAGADYDELMRPATLLPYADFAKLGQSAPARDIKATARALLAEHMMRRPAANPVAAFAERVEAQALAVAERGPAFFHLYAFNTLRQLGANFELLGSHLTWLFATPDADALAAIEACAAIAAGAKAFQFRLARATARAKFEGLAAALAPLADAHARAMDALSRRLARP